MIFADFLLPDPDDQNETDPDPKQCLQWSMSDPGINGRFRKPWPLLQKHLGPLLKCLQFNWNE